jgi:hypothetical protein
MLFSQARQEKLGLSKWNKTDLNTSTQPAALQEN